MITLGNMRAALLAFAFFTPFTLQQSETGVVAGRVLSADGTASAGVRVAAVPVPEAGRGEAAEILSAITQTDASGTSPSALFLQIILGGNPVGFRRAHWRRPITGTDFGVNHGAVHFLGQDGAEANAIVCECIRGAAWDVDRAFRRSEPPDPSA
jgi:hypothetical protein